MKVFVRVVPGNEFLIGNPALGHPIDGPIAADGSYWEADFFTFRMRDVDNLITVDDTVEPLTGPLPTPI